MMKSVTKRKGVPCAENDSACHNGNAGTAVPAWDGGSCVWTGR